MKLFIGIAISKEFKGFVFLAELLRVVHLIFCKNWNENINNLTEIVIQILMIIEYCQIDFHTLNFEALFFFNFNDIEKIPYFGKVTF